MQPSGTIQSGATALAQFNLGSKFDSIFICIYSHFSPFFPTKTTILYESDKILTKLSFLYSPFLTILFRQNSSNQISKFDSIFVFSTFLLNTSIQFMQKAENFSFFVIRKHTVKHIITLRIPKLLQKNLLFFFTVYKNECKEHKF